MFTNVKGTHDIIGYEASAYNYIESVMKNIAELFNYSESRPPVIESSEIFIRGVGEGSDVVRKEMYTFLDKGDRSITLRPEFTAGIIRLIVQNKLLANTELPFKTYYLGPVFRYERPQLGRYRQFNQFGVESVGNDSYANDVEVICLAYTILSSLGLENLKVKINTLGDDTSREHYKEALKEYFAKHIDKMCPDCKERLKLNPLRILDCKDLDDQEIVKNAPKMDKYITSESKERFDKVTNCLNSLGVQYEIDNTLVRGLDYYSDTVFEFHYQSQSGNDYGAIGGGGHYNKLVKELGGPDCTGVGFSFGIERVFSVLKDDNLIPDEVTSSVAFYVMPVGIQNIDYCLNAANICRLSGYKTELCFDNTKIGNMFKRAERKQAKFALIVGDDEKNSESVIIKNLQTQNQEKVALNNLSDYIDQLFDEHECHCHDGECCCGNHDNNDSEHECCCDDDCCCGHHKK